MSAVIKTSAEFQVFLAREVSAAHLHVTSLALRKQDYDAWLSTVVLSPANSSSRNLASAMKSNLPRRGALTASLAFLAAIGFFWCKREHGGV